MKARNAIANWQGNLKEGKGQLHLGSGVWEGPYDYRTRFEEDPGTNPEELIGAAHAGCFSMALAAELGKAGYTPKRIETNAHVQLGQDEKRGGFSIDLVRLILEADVPNIEEGEFKRIANEAKDGCPVSKALAGTTITLEPTLKQ